jgi:hypothetical protein
LKPIFPHKIFSKETKKETPEKIVKTLIGGAIAVSLTKELLR